MWPLCTHRQQRDCSHFLCRIHFCGMRDKQGPHACYTSALYSATPLVLPPFHLKTGSHCCWDWPQLTVLLPQPPKQLVLCHFCPGVFIYNIKLLIRRMNASHSSSHTTSQHSVWPTTPSIATTSQVSERKQWRGKLIKQDFWVCGTEERTTYGVSVLLQTNTPQRTEVQQSIHNSFEETKHPGINLAKEVRECDHEDHNSLKKEMEDIRKQKDVPIPG